MPPVIAVLPRPEPSSFRSLSPPPPTVAPAQIVPPPLPSPPHTSYVSQDTIDEETVLANVEEMLEGFEWRGGVSSSGWGGSGSRNKADEIEKRLVGELKALEAVSRGVALHIE